jgi:hypothetical protein
MLVGGFWSFAVVVIVTSDKRGGGGGDDCGCSGSSGWVGVGRG